MLHTTCCMKILGIRIDNFSKKEILEKIEFFLTEEKFHQIATVNPEFILQTRKNEEFKKILNGCDLNIADGIGLKYAFVRFGKWLKYRFAGVDLMHEILKIAEGKKMSVFLAVNANGLSFYEEIRNILTEKYSNIKFIGENIDHNVTCHMSHVARCDILFCNFGAPYQEVFINSVKNDSIRLAMGVGGSFDFLTGKVKRAPKFIRNFGLEWLWRFVQEPKYRFKRIINAVIVFPLRVIFKK